MTAGTGMCRPFFFVVTGKVQAKKKVDPQRPFADNTDRPDTPCQATRMPPPGRSVGKSRQAPDRAIAQLGERLLCKQEVVGSIPSGSTKFLSASM